MSILLISCSRKHDAYILNSDVSLFKGNVLSLNMYLSKKIQINNNDVSKITYYSDSIFSYEIIKDDKTIFSFNKDNAEKHLLDIKVTVWVKIEEYENEICLKEIGEYKIKNKS